MDEPHFLYLKGFSIEKIVSFVLLVTKLAPLLSPAPSLSLPPVFIIICLAFMKGATKGMLENTVVGLSMYKLS